MRLKHQRFSFKAQNILINLMEILLDQFGQEQQFFQILRIQKQPNFGAKDFPNSIKNLSLTEFGLIWMKLPHYAMIIKENVQLILQNLLYWLKVKTGVQYSILKLQTQSLFKIKLYLLMLSTLALNRMRTVSSIISIHFMEYCKANELMRFKIWESIGHSWSQDLLSLAQVNMLLIGLETIGNHGSTWDTQFQACMIWICLEFQW